MKKFSVSATAKLLEVDRRTLQRWVTRKAIPRPEAGELNGRLVKFWNEAEVALIRENKSAHYAGKGLNRRTGTKAKQAKL